MSYEPKLAAALSGASLSQLSHWRSNRGRTGALLVPELSSRRPVLYSFRDVVALRTFVRLRETTSLQKIRQAVGNLRTDLGASEHLSQYRLIAEKNTVFLAEPDHAVDLIKGGQTVIIAMVDVLKPFYYGGRHVPDLLRPRDHLAVMDAVRGGEPVIAGTRIPSAEVAALIRDGFAAEDVADIYPGVSPAAARDAFDFSEYVESYDTSRKAAAA